MKVKYIGESEPLVLLNGKVYECLGEEDGHYRVIDEEGADEDEELQGYLYPKRLFEIVGETGRDG